MGGKFFIGNVHQILTRQTYAGVHYWNRYDSRSQKPRPREDWVAVEAPQIISAAEFARVQEMLKARRPTITAPRIVNSQVLLTNIARCEACGAAMVLSTGKSGRYRYYTCSSARLKGLQACKDRVTVPEQELDTLVLSALAGTLITGERLVGLLREATRHRREMVSQTAVRRQALKTSLKNIDTQLGRLLEAVADGLLPDMAALRSKVDQLNAERDECSRHLALLDAPIPAYRQGLSNRQAETVALTLKRRLLDAPKAIQRNYVRGLVGKVVVGREVAVISGSNAALAACASNPENLPAVPALSRKWCALGESNPSCKIENLES